ncbi:polysaccharide deacetylase family protein [Actinocrispum wychmicini]|uniref:Peptidoglycan/xylan/chitin deacetylase (PgdA/CDA1 family) n=1 Tax=Actinocrispum wychmicini TaxID=1213861 RepID=A0A4R2IUN2_9PSEU|nr:polysaccharide deacetylase family protein [Actinocrispum wychmicini]TCO48009.1 peptidoglycan/xylan/chitin deacetylase (PgdA/CDA1 family) [Actinocrispum wychmicini]
MEGPVSEQPNSVPRRRFIGLGLGAAALAACSAPPETRPTPPVPTSASSTTTLPPSSTLSSAAKPAGGPATELVRAASGRPEVALTFHGAGDVGIARQVLAALAQHNAHVTVLAVGTWLQDSPDAARMVLDGGHELGNHTWSHPNLSTYKPEPMLAEIERCRDRLVQLTGSPGAFFRQSQGQHANAEELREAGKAGYANVLSYDIDSLDWRDPGAAAIRKAVTAATAGSVVSMHLGHPGTVAALPGILTDLANRGLTPVTASKLMG